MSRQGHFERAGTVGAASGRWMEPDILAACGGAAIRTSSLEGSTSNRAFGPHATQAGRSSMANIAAVQRAWRAEEVRIRSIPMIAPAAAAMNSDLTVNSRHNWPMSFASFPMAADDGFQPAYLCFAQN